MEQIQVFSKNKRILPINLKEELLKHDIIEKKYGLLLRNEKKIHQFIDFCEGLINQAAFYLLLIYTNKIKYKIKYLRTQEDEIEFYKKQYDKFYNDLINNELIYRFDSKKEISKNFGKNGLILDYLDYCLLLYEKNKFSAKELEKYDLIREWEDIAGKRRILNYLDNKIKKRKKSKHNNPEKQKIKEALARFELLKQKNPEGEQILKDETYNELYKLTETFIKTGDYKSPDNKFRPVIDINVIRLLFYKINNDLYPRNRKTRDFIQFMIDVFKLPHKWNKSYIDKHYSDRLPNSELSIKYNQFL